MKKILSILFVFTPLLACATENPDYRPAAVLEHIARITSAKSNLTDRQYWRVLLQWDDECESGFNYSESFSGLDVYSESERKFIIQVTCTLGAYQGYQRFYHLSLGDEKTAVKVIMFPIYEVVKNKSVTRELSADVVGNLTRDSTYKNLTVHRRYSGYGNCGTLTTYQVINGEVTATRFRSEPDCESEKASRDPEKWPEYAIP